MYQGLSHIRTDAHVVTRGNQGIYVPTGTEYLGVADAAGNPTFRVPRGQLAITDRYGRILDPGTTSVATEPVIKFVVGSGNRNYIFSSSQIHGKLARSVFADCPQAASGQVTDVLFNCLDCNAYYHLNVYMTSALFEEEFGNVPLVNQNFIKTPCCDCADCSSAATCSTVAQQFVDSINFSGDRQNRNFIRARLLYGNSTSICLPTVSTCDGVRVGVITQVTIGGVATPINGGNGYDVVTQTSELEAAIQAALGGTANGSIKITDGPDCDCAAGEWQVQFNHIPTVTIDSVTLVAAVECSAVATPAPVAVVPTATATDLLVCDGVTYNCGIRIFGLTPEEYYSNCLGLTGDRVSDSVISALTFEVQTEATLGAGYDYSCQMKVVDRCAAQVSKGTGRRLWYEQKSANRDTISVLDERAVTHEIPAPEQTLGIFNVDQQQRYFITSILHDNRAEFTHGIDTYSQGELTTLVSIPENDTVTRGEWITFVNNYFDCVKNVEDCPTSFSGSDTGYYL